jgi:hypothetical protein
MTRFVLQAPRRVRQSHSHHPKAFIPENRSYFSTPMNFADETGHIRGHDPRILQISVYGKRVPVYSTPLMFVRLLLEVLPHDHGRREEARPCGSSNSTFVLLISIFMVYYIVLYK